MASRKKRTKWIGITLALVLCLGAGLWFYSGSWDRQPDTGMQREREYTAAMGDITVGIQVSGKMTGEQLRLSGTNGLTVARFLTGKGDWLSPGDPIAEYTQESIAKALSETFEEYKKADQALKDARTERKSGLSALASRLTAEKKLNDRTYQAYVKSLRSLQTRLENELSTLQEQLQQQPEDAGLRLRQEQAEQELAMAAQMMQEVERRRTAEKAEETDTVLQAERELADIRLLDDRVALAEREYQRLRDRLTQLQALVQDPVVYATQEGAVLSLDIQPGETLAEGKSLATLSLERNWQFSFQAEQDEVAGIEAGQRVELVANAFPTDVMTGTVERVSRVADDEGKYEVTVRLEDASLDLREGMSGYGTVILRQKKHVLTLANKAIAQRDGRQLVQVRGEQGELEERQITTGFSDGRVSEILTGLEAGDVVVVVDTL